VEIVFAGEGRYLALAREAGFRVVPATTMDPDLVLRCSRAGRANWWNGERLRAYVKADLEVFARERPDLVLGDFRLSLGTSCEHAGSPSAITLNAAWTNYSSARSRAPEHLAITRALGRPLATRLLPWIREGILRWDARPFRRLRRELGLSPGSNIWDAWRGDLNLIVDTPEYGPTEHLPGNYHYIGPIVWEPDVEPPSWLAELDPDRPIVYVTMGSTGDPRFFDAAVDLFGHTELQVIMTTAGLARLPELPPNCRAVELAPGSRLMEVSDVVVCQGGNGTIYQALAHGVPIVGIPTMHDQEFNLDRVEALGVGIHLSELRFRPEDLRGAVRRTLEDESFRRNAAWHAERLRGFDAPRRGAELILRQISDRAA